MDIVIFPPSANNITVRATFLRSEKKTTNETVTIEKENLKLCNQSDVRGTNCTNSWIYILSGGLVLSIIISLTLIAVTVQWKNKARNMKKEVEMKNMLYGTEYYEGSKITEKNPSYGVAA